MFEPMDNIEVVC